VINTDLGHMSHHFRDTTTYSLTFHSKLQPNSCR